MPAFRFLGTQVNNIIGSFPGVLYFKFDEYNGKKVKHAPLLKSGQSTVHMSTQSEMSDLSGLDTPDAQTQAESSLPIYYPVLISLPGK